MSDITPHRIKHYNIAQDDRLQPFLPRDDKGLASLVGFVVCGLATDGSGGVA
jgi:hypothetical protein